MLIGVCTLYGQHDVITPVDERIEFLYWKEKLTNRDTEFIKETIASEFYYHRVLPLIGIHRLKNEFSLNWKANKKKQSQ